MKYASFKTDITISVELQTSMKPASLSRTVIHRRNDSENSKSARNDTKLFLLSYFW